MKCALCGVEISKKATYCRKCREIKRRETKRNYVKRNYVANKNKNELIIARPYKSLVEVLQDIRKYNEEHGTRYSYGQYMAALKLRKINKRADNG